MNRGYIQLPNQQSISFVELGEQYLGQKPTLFFIHGNFSSKQWWIQTLEGLSDFKHHLIAIDQRGFGQSSFKNKCLCFNDWAEDLRQFCKIKNIKQCVAIGWSFGGGVSMKFAQICPQIVQKVILTCSVAHQGLTLSEGGVPCKTIEQIKQNSKSKFMLALLESKSKQTMIQVFDSVLLTHAKDYPSDKKDRLIVSAFQQRSYAEVLFCLANSDININKIKASGLMIHGKHDLVIPINSVTNTGNYFKNIVILENNAHMIPIESPGQYESLIKKFVLEQ